MVQCSISSSKHENVQYFNFTVVLCGCETWPVATREETRLREV
jgi:hypothetical protein